MDFKQYLTYFGWTQAQFAREIGVTADTVSRWKGSPPKIYLLYLNALWTHSEYTKGLKAYWNGRDCGV